MGAAEPEKRGGERSFKSLRGPEKKGLILENVWKPGANALRPKLVPGRVLGCMDKFPNRPE